jgi:hypothetical protein
MKLWLKHTKLAVLGANAIASIDVEEHSLSKVRRSHVVYECSKVWMVV